jgi:hypothetical protein
MKVRLITSATQQVRQRWFSECIFPLGHFFGLTGIENQRSQIARNPPLRVASYEMEHTWVQDGCFAKFPACRRQASGQGYSF